MFTVAFVLVPDVHWTPILRRLLPGSLFEFQTILFLTEFFSHALRPIGLLTPTVVAFQ